MKFTKQFILMALLFISWGVKAHQPGVSSTVLAEQENGKWFLQIRTALTALESEVRLRFSKDSYETPEEFKEKVIEMFKETISVSFDEQDAVLVNPEVKLGHETIILFEFKGLEAYQDIKVVNRSFEHIYKSKSTLVLLKKGFKKNKFFLEKENNYTVYLRTDRLSFKEIHPEQEQENQNRIIRSVGLIIVLVLVFYVVFRRFRNN